MAGGQQENGKLFLFYSQKWYYSETWGVRFICYNKIMCKVRSESFKLMLATNVRGRDVIYPAHGNGTLQKASPAP